MTAVRGRTHARGGGTARRGARVRVSRQTDALRSARHARACRGSDTGRRGARGAARPAWSSCRAARRAARTQAGRPPSSPSSTPQGTASSPPSSRRGHARRPAPARAEGRERSAGPKRAKRAVSAHAAWARRGGGKESERMRHPTPPRAPPSVRTRARPPLVDTCPRRLPTRPWSRFGRPGDARDARAKTFLPRDDVMPPSYYEHLLAEAGRARAAAGRQQAFPPSPKRRSTCCQSQSSRPSGSRPSQSGASACRFGG